MISEALSEKQVEHEIAKIEKDKLTLNEYIRMSRVGESFRLNRKARKNIFAEYAKRANVKLDREMAMETGAGRVLSFASMRSYDAITKYRDEVMYESA